MMNEEKRDRKLRETFEQCLSGIDTLPSQRAEITKKLSEAPAHTGRIAFRAIALPAALTLLLCAGIGVFSGLQGSQPYPDPLKTDATLVAEKPLPTDFVPLAQPEGEGGTDTVVLEGNSVTWDQWGAVVPTVEPEPKANVRAAWFFSRWRDHKWTELLEMCSQEWRDRQPDPAAALAELTGFMTPDTFEIEAVTGIGEAEGSGYVMHCTASDRENPETQYMVSLNIKKENGGLWYINPDSLKDYTVLASQRLPENAEENIPEEERLRQALVQADPALAASLVPVGLSCESSGIRLEIISAALSEESALVVYSLEDLEGSRLTDDPSLEYPILSIGPSYSGSSWSSYLPYRYADPAANRIILAACSRFNQPADLTTFSRTVSLSITDLRIFHEHEIDLIPLLREYGGQPRALTSPPGDTTGFIQSIPEDTQFTNSRLRELGVKVLDPAGSREIPLGDYAILSGIDLDQNGILRLQLHDSPGHDTCFPVIQSASGIIQEEDFIRPDLPSHLYWNGNSQVPGTWQEIQLKLNGEIRDDASLVLETGAFAIAVSGSWSIEVPTEQIWVSTAGSAAAEAPAAEPEETAEAKIIPYANTRLLKCIQLWRAENWQGLLDLCVPAWKEQTADPLETLKNLFPFGMPEIVDSTPLKSGETEYTTDCILRSRSDRETWYHAAISMQKEADGLWYLDPESLRDCKAMTAIEILEFRTARAESLREYSYGTDGTDVTYSSDPMSFLRAAYHSLADSLVPVGLTCDSGDIRLEIISAAVEKEKALIVFSLQDLAENRNALQDQDINFWPSFLPPLSLPGSSLSLYPVNTDYEAKATTYALYVPDGQMFSSDRGALDFRLPEKLLIGSVGSVDLMPLLREYGNQAGALVDPPEDLSGSLIPGEEYTDIADRFRKQEWKVLDYSHPLDIPLSEHVLLSGIGLKEDGKLHVQLHIVGNEVITEINGSPVTCIADAAVYDISDKVHQPLYSAPVCWRGGEDEYNGFVEYLFPCDPDLVDSLKLSATIVKVNKDVIRGNWEIQVPLDTIRVSNPE